MMATSILVFLLLSPGGCAKQVFYWGGYENCLYSQYFKEDPDQAFAVLAQTVAQAEKGEHRLAPGLYAEYGFLLYQRGNASQAAVYFQKEAEAFPESATLMNTLIARLKQPKVRNEGKQGSVEKVDAPIVVEPAGVEK